MDAEIIKLVEEAKNKSEKAFTKLYNKYQKTIWFTIYSIVKNVDVTDDLVSSVFTKAYIKLDSYTNYISFEMWLKTIAVNSAIDYIRKYKYEQLNNYVDDEDYKIQLNDLNRNPEEDTVLKEQTRIVLETIPTLKKKYRDLIEAKLDGLSYKDMSKKFNKTESTIKSLLNKARQTLKRKINNIV